MAGKDLRASQRAALLTAGIAVLGLGILGGLWRQDWELPLPGTQPASFHGALAVAAFFGTLIGLEYAAAYGQRLAYLGPACAVLGGLMTAFGAPHLVSASLLLVAAVLLAVLAFGNWSRDRALHAALGLSGALCGVAGNAFWLLGFPASRATGAWLAFLVLTVVGERLELSHLKPPGKLAAGALAAATALLAGGALVLPWCWSAGVACCGAALVGLSAWLLVEDVARLNLRHRRQARFVSVCLVGGYVWLGLGGLALPFAAADGAFYDGALHAVFIGFVFAAVIGHAAAILPGLLNVEVPYTPLYYVHLVLLNATLAARFGGDLLGRAAWRAWGGLGNAVALALFLVLTAVAVRRGTARQVRS